MVGVTFIGDDGVASESPFAAVIDKVMTLGGTFPKVVGTCAMTAALAAIMSTADSAIIAASHLITMELLIPNFPNSIDRRTVVWYSRIVSLFCASTAVLVGLSWRDGVAAVQKIQFPLSAQSLPAFLIGLFTTSSRYDFHPWGIVAGAVCGSLLVLVFYFSGLAGSESARAINGGIIGLLLNVFVCFSGEAVRRWKRGQEVLTTPCDGRRATVLFSERPNWDIPETSHFSDVSLSPELLNIEMRGVAEPYRNIWWLLLFVLSIAMVTPFAPEHQPPIEGGNFVYPPSLIWGLPWWFAMMLGKALFATIFVVLTICYIPDLLPKTSNHGSTIDSDEEKSSFEINM